MSIYIYIYVYIYIIAEDLSVYGQQNAVSLLGWARDSQNPLFSVSVCPEQRLYLLDCSLWVADSYLAEGVVGLNSSGCTVCHLHDVWSDAELGEVAKEYPRDTGEGTVAQGVNCGVASCCQQDVRVRSVSVGRLVLLAPDVVPEEFAKLLLLVIVLFICRFGWYEGRCEGQVVGLVF